MAASRDAQTELNTPPVPGWWGFLRANPRQLIKIVVYSLLLVNFVHYIGNDIEIARHTSHEGWGFKDWSTAFATTLDESAWFVLLMLLELETYLLSDEAFTRTRVLVMQGLRLVCYLAIGHTVFAFAEYLVDLSRAVEHVGVPLCSFAEDGLSFTRNLEYWELDGSNCGFLSADTTFFQFAQGQVLSDSAGMRVEWELAWVDLIEVVVWLLIMVLIEIILRLQERGVSDSPLLRFARYSKVALYTILWGAAAYWGYRGHWLFTWDEALWILGFVAIGMNLSEWRREMEDAGAVAATPVSS